MNKTETRLSDEAKAFAEKNIGILFAFVRRYHLPEDYFGALAVAYVRFVGKYLYDRENYAYNFSTLVWQRMRSELSHLMRKEKSEQLVISANNVSETMGQEDNYFEQESFHTYSCNLTQKQTQVLMLRIEGYTNAQIASILEISEGAVERRFKRIRSLFN